MSFLQASSELAKRHQAGWSSLEELFTHPDLFGMTTASPVQRAILRVLDGRPLADLALDPDVVAAFGCPTHLLPRTKPFEMAIAAGIRGGKSQIAACCAIHWSQVANLDGLKPGEIPRVNVLATSKDVARPLYMHVLGSLTNSPRLKKILVGEPGREIITVKHPSGRPIEIAIVAGSRAGASLVGRWSVGTVLDEAGRMNGSDDSKINLDDSRRAVIQRIRPGGQLLCISSPWTPTGPFYEMVKAGHGKPSEKMVVVRAPAWVLNPVYWTPERVAQAKAADPDAYVTDICAEFLSGEDSFFTSSEIEGAIRQAPASLPYVDGQHYRAAMDPATRGNGWTLVIATRVGNQRIVAHAQEWRGSRAKSLKPSEVLGEIAEVCRRYQISTVESDQYMIDALADIAKRDFALNIIETRLSEKEKTERCLAMKAKFAAKEIELPPNELLRVDLQRVRKVATQNGTSIRLPLTKGDGRHCDYVPSLILALGEWIRDAVPVTGPASIADQMKAMRFAQVKKDNETPWWKKPFKNR